MKAFPKGLKLPGLLLVLVVLVAGCAGPAIRCVGPGDSPPHYYLKGMALLEAGKRAEGAASFERALACDETHSLSHGGMAIIRAESAKEMQAPGNRGANSEKALNRLERAFHNADTREKEFAGYLAAMRVATALKREGWLEEVEKSYEKAMNIEIDESQLLYYESADAAPFFMGIAYVEANRLRRAQVMFRNVLAMERSSRWRQRAEKGLKRTATTRASAGITLTEPGKKSTLLKAVKRSELAALLADELALDRLLSDRAPAASASAPARLAADTLPVDITGHRLEQAILLMLKWGIGGFEPLYDLRSGAYFFKPEAAVTRGELAIILEDIIVKLIGDEEITTAYLGRAHSPYSDVPVTAPWYNAVMNVTTRDLMEADKGGAFRPDEPVEDADVLLAIRVLKRRMDID